MRPSKFRPVGSRVARMQVIERLEDRVLLSAFVASGSALNVDLNTANANVAIVSSGTSCTLTLTGDTWNGTDSANVTGNGTNTLTVTAAGLAAFDTFNITDSTAGESVTFDDSGANTYQDNFSVVLDNTDAGAITFNGATHFAGSSSLSASTTRNIQLNSGSSVTTINGNLTLSANAAGTTTGDFSGLRLENATIQTTGSGNIVVTGRGGNDAATGSHFGIALFNGSLIDASGTGAVTLTGTGGVGNGQDAGVDVEASQVTAVSGGITVTGNANASATGDYNIGVRVLFGGQIKATGSGGVTINGTGAGGANNNWGVSVEAANSLISVVDGTLSITGTGSANSTGDFNVGVLVDNGAELKSTGWGNLNIAGAGGTGANPYAIMLGSAGMGTITTSAGTGSLTLVGDGISIDVVNGSSINAGANLVTLKQKTNGTMLNLGGADVFSGSPLTLGLTDAEVDRITAGTVQIGDASSGAITVSAAISSAAPTNLVLTSGASITVNEGLATNGGSLTLSATNGITLSNSLTTSGGNVTLSADSDANGSGTLTISAVSWSQPTQLNEASGAARDNFGSSVALSSDGNTAIVGAYGDDVDGKPNQGTATIFVRSGGVWTQQVLLTATGGATGDNFGISVALSSDGNTAIVGAYGDTISGNGSQGSATIFIRSGGVWTQQQQVTATGGAAVDFFGNAVALSSDGNTAIVGAYVDDVGGNVNQGSATIFTRSGGVWTQQQQVTAPAGAARDNFGSSVALSSDGNTAIVGADMDDVGGNGDQGTATIYTRSGGVWTQQQQVTATGGTGFDHFGASVALSSDGNTAIVGASWDDVGGNMDQGSATIFTRSSGVWTQQQQMTATGGAANDFFGFSVALNSAGNTAIVGADWDDVGVNADQGSAFTFVQSNPGSISAGGGTITIQAADMDLQGTLSSTATVSLSSEQAGRAIDLGTNTANALGLTDAELDQISAGQLNIGGVNSGAITVSAAINRAASTTLQLKSGGAINFTTGSLASAGGDVTLDPGTSVGPTTTGLDVNAGTGALAFGSNDDLAIDITGTTVDTQFRQLNVIGVVSLTGVDLVLSGSPSLAGGESFTIVNNDGTDAVVGTFNGLAEGATISNFLGSGKNARISYVGGTGNEVVVTVNSAPVIGSFNSTVAYTASGPATVLGANASVTDVDTTRFNGATLTISQSGFTEASDRLEIRSVTRLVAVSGSNVTYRGTIVGTVSGGTGGSALVIVFNGNATQSAVQTVLRNVTFRSVSATPATTTRTVQITLTDGEGGTSNVPMKSVTIVASPGAIAPDGVVPANPAPTAVSAPVARALEAAFAAQTMAMSSATSNVIKPVADTGDLAAPAFIKALTEWRLAVACASTTSASDSHSLRRFVRHAMITEIVSSVDHATNEQTLVDNADDDFFVRIENVVLEGADFRKQNKHDETRTQEMQMMLIEHSGNVRCFGTCRPFKAVWATMILFGIVSIARVHGQETLTLQGAHPRLRFDDNADTTQAWNILGDNVSLDVINETAGTTPFRVDPLAFHNSLVVGSFGQIGFGTYDPRVELHVSTNHFSPTIRLEMTGVAPRTWDLQASASAFSILDVTAATRAFTIVAGAPTDSFRVDTTGMIGLGTSTPAARLHASVPAVAGVESIVKFDISDDAIGKLEINNASATNGVFHPRFRGTTNAQAVGLTFEGAITDDIGANPVVSFAASKIVGGSVTNRPLLVVRNNQTVRVRVAANGDMFATSFSPTSSRALKDNIVDLDSQKASKALQQLTPVEYVYKDDSSAEGRVGFIAEDVPELVANADRKSVPIMDVLALVTRVVKDQQQTIDEQKKVIDEQTKFISEQRNSNDEQKRLNDQLAKRLEDLEKRFQGK